MFGIKQIRGSWNLRLDKDGELEGLDIVEHGTPAYHVEFGYGMSYTTPTGGTSVSADRPSTSRRNQRTNPSDSRGAEREVGAVPLTQLPVPASPDIRVHIRIPPGEDDAWLIS